jgi:hypothetical protein
VQLLVTAMYGYPGVIKVQNYFGGVIPELTKTYYGLTAGAGYVLYDKNKKNKLVLEILVPFRSTELNDPMSS